MSKGNVARAGQPRRVAAVNFFLSKARCIVEKIAVVAIARDLKYIRSGMKQDASRTLDGVLNRAIDMVEREDRLRKNGVAVIHAERQHERMVDEMFCAMGAAREKIARKYRKSEWRVKALARVIVDERVSITTRDPAAKFLVIAAASGVDVSVAARELARVKDHDISVKALIIDALSEVMRSGSDEAKERVRNAMPGIEMLARKREAEIRRIEERFGGAE